MSRAADVKHVGIAGIRLVEMDFLPNVFVNCESCNGKRYNRDTLEVRYKGKSISDVLDMTVSDAVIFLKINQKYQIS